MTTKKLNLKEVIQGQYLLINNESFLVEELENRFNCANEGEPIKLHHSFELRGEIIIHNPMGEKIVLNQKSEIIQILKF